jgi:acetyltransferase-like isoleucine patch superfamily enzyme
MIRGILKHLWCWHLRRQGLNMSPDCRFMGFPSFGSEPWLITIGPHVTIAPGVTFITHDGGTWVFREQERYSRVIKYGRIIVHRNCFIGDGATLMPGISIGPDAVVAAGAVVTRSVPPGTVVAGVPARVVCTVFDYAERCLTRTPEYDVEAYLKDKRREVLRVIPVPASAGHEGKYAIHS